MNTPRNHRKLRLVVILSSLALPLPPLGAEPFLLVAPFPLVAEEGAPAADRATVFARKIGREHRLLHETYRNDNWEIFVRDSDGGNARNLTNTPDVHEMYPQASPDGSKICFVADEIVNGKKARSVYTMNRDGKARTLVARSARQPCWSPDSGTIAYLKSEFPVFNVTDFATKGLHFFDVEKNKHREHPNAELHHLYNITWSRDGRWIVSTVHGGMGYGHAILAIEIDGPGVYDLKIPGCRPDFSPDGTRLTWGKDDHTIAVGDFDVSSGRPVMKNVRELIRAEKMHLYHSEWTPNGKFISFSRGPGGRVPPKGPGTCRGLAEFVGVRATWDICVVSADAVPSPDVPSPGKAEWVKLTDDGESNKESSWLPPVARGGSK